MERILQYESPSYFTRLQITERIYERFIILICIYQTNIFINQILIQFGLETGSRTFFYAVKKDNWLLLQDKVDASYLSPRNVYGFVGTVLGMYATSLDKPSNNKAAFDWLEYTGKDKITK